MDDREMDERLKFLEQGLIEILQKVGIIEGVIQQYWEDLNNPDKKVTKHKITKKDEEE